MRVLVAIPSYRCEKQIVRVLQGFDSSLLARLEKVLVIDNRSPDGTAQAAQATIDRLGLAPKVEVVINNENYGLGGSQKLAFLQGLKMGVDYVAILHGDDQAKTEELNLFLDEAQRHPQLGAILGSRFMFSSRRENYSLIRTLGNMGLNALYTLLTGRMTKDLGSGLNLFKTEALKDRHFVRFADAFTFNMDMLLDLFSKNTAIRFLPIAWREFDQVSNARTFRVGWITLKTLLAWRIGKVTDIGTSPERYGCRPLKELTGA